MNQGQEEEEQIIEIFSIKQELDPSVYFDDDLQKLNTSTNEQQTFTTGTSSTKCCCLCKNHYQLPIVEYSYQQQQQNNNNNRARLRFVTHQLQLKKHHVLSPTTNSLSSPPPPICQSCAAKLDHLQAVYKQLAALQAEFKRLKVEFVEVCNVLSVHQKKANHKISKANKKRKADSFSDSEPDTGTGPDPDPEYTPGTENDPEISDYEEDLGPNSEPEPPGDAPPSKSSLRSCYVNVQRLKPTPTSKNKSSNNSCQVCSKSFRTPKHLRKHELRVHSSNRQRFPCSLCTKSFCGKSELNRHLIRIHNAPAPASAFNAEAARQEEIRCEICNKTCTKREKLAAHVRTVHKYIYKPLLCDKCPTRRFIFPNELKRHKVLVHGEEETAVEEQQSVANTNNALNMIFDPETEHLHQQLIEESKTCKECGLRFERVVLLRRHEREACHGEARNNQCEHCGKAFTIKSALLMHIERHHVSPEPPSGVGETSFPQRKDPLTKSSSSLTCPYCCQVFHWKNGFNKHLATVHPAQHLATKPYLCQVCYKTYESDALLQTHSANSHYKCSMIGCSKTFLSISSVTRHELIHTGLKPFSCSICGKSFNNHGNLVLHEKLHAGLKPSFKCKDCEYEFGKRKLLEAHRNEMHCQAY